MIVRKSLIAVACLTLALAALPAVAQEHDEAATKAAWAAAATPGDAHAFLAERAGDWNVVATSWMEPDAEPMVSTSTSHAEMILGGRFLQEHLTGTVMGMPFEGMGLTGYDNTIHEVTGVWIDNMGTVTGIVSGLYEKIGEPMELLGEMADAVTGQKITIRTVTTFVGKNEHRMDYYMSMPGMDEMKSMEMVYTRQ